MPGPEDDARARKALLAAAWDEAARGYERYFVPRFSPWIDDAISALASRASALPEGLVLVPCCGPGHELPLVASALSGRDVAGVDLSRGMVEVARARAAGLANVRVEQGDACALEGAFAGNAAALLSCFGLQQIPGPAEALASWARCLRPGGLLSVVFWPPEREDAPFETLRALVAARVPPPDSSWGKALVPSLERAGATLLEDRRIAHVMQHESAREFFLALSRWGPLRSLALSKGEAFMEELGSAFVREMPAGPLEHSPVARLLVARRP
ncbi:class I SAM-dependent methyltransferase [bacterium]|nr:class I SAM-dependent methyltransferase [bacterium]